MHRYAKIVVLFCAALGALAGPPQDEAAIAAAVADAPAAAQPTMAAEKLPLDADWALAGADHRRSATRERICLNNLWRFQPEWHYGEAPDPEQWAYLRVPGMWCDAWGFVNFTYHAGEDTEWYDEMMLYRRTGMYANRWEGKDLSRYSIGWYERLFTVPADWRNREVAIDFTQIDAAATVYLNGRRLGEIGLPGGEIVLPPDDIRYGESNAITVRVVGPGYRGRDGFHLRSGWGGGLGGDVFLRARPAAVRLQSPFLRPSTRQERLDVQVRIGTDAGLTDTRLRIAIEDAQGRGAYTHTARLDPLPAGSTQVSATLPWMANHLWSPDHPYLYRATLSLLSADGRVLDELLPVTFGFREFWIEGRQFILNGHPLRLRPYLDNRTAWGCEYTDAAVNRILTFRQTLGFNAFEVRGSKLHPGEGLSYYDNMLRETDRRGMIVLWQLEDVVTRGESPDMDDPDVWAAYRERALVEPLTRLANHPSIFMWSPSMNVNGNRDEAAPWLFGGEPDLSARDPELTAAQLKALAALRELDPTRAVFFHDGLNLGPIANANYHFNFPQLQEREEFPSAWAADGVKPLMLVEAADCFPANFQQNRMGHGNAFGQPLFTEYLAMYQGPKAYRDESPDYVRGIAEDYLGEEKWYMRALNTMLIENPSFLEMASLFTVNTRRAWRTWGVPGGLVPWFGIGGSVGYGGEPMGGLPRHDLPPGPAAELKQPGVRVDRWEIPVNRQFGQSYRYTYPGLPEEPTGEPFAEANAIYRAMWRVNRPLMAYIAGHEGRFTAKDHGYFAGDTVRKQIAIVWDGSSERHLTATWRVVDNDGRVLATDAVAVQLVPGAIELMPFTFKAPAVEAVQSLTIELTVAEDGWRLLDTACTDSLALEIYPRPPAVATTRRTVLYDPPGLTAEWLQRTGLDFTRVTRPTAVPADTEVLIVGREALTPTLFKTCVGRIAEGLSLLVFEQQAQTLKTLGFRTVDIAPRRAFATGTGSAPYLAGIPPAGLRDWRGSSTLVDPYPRKLMPPVQKTQMYRWGNYGTVATVIIEKPHRDAFTPILDTEFDLRYSPLMNWRIGAGQVLFCQLDITGRYGVEPAATRLAHNILNQMQQEPRGVRPLVVLDEATAEIVAAHGFAPVHGEAEKLPASAVVVISNRTDAKLLTSAGPHLDRLAGNGGRVVCLFLDETAFSTGFLPFSLGGSPAAFSRTELAGGPFTDGISIADLHYRRFLETTLLNDLPSGSARDKLGALAAVPHGRGAYIFWQVDPALLDPGRMIERERRDPVPADFTRYSQWHVHRVVSQLLTNAGAATAPQRAAEVCAAGWQMDISGSWQVKAAGDALDAEAERYAAIDLDSSAWAAMELPCGRWPGQSDNPALAGRQESVREPYSVWYRRTVHVPADLAGQPLMLSLGVIDDADITYVNGIEVGRITRETSDTFWKDESRYTVPPEALRYGEDNVILFRMTDYQGGWGAFVWGPSMTLEVQGDPGTDLYTEPLTVEDNPYRVYWW